LGLVQKDQTVSIVFSGDWEVVISYLVVADVTVNVFILKDWLRWGSNEVFNSL